MVGPILICLLIIGVLCLIMSRGVLLTLLTIGLSILLICSLLLSFAAGISFLGLIALGGAAFEPFLVWLMAASTWAISAGMLTFINTYCDNKNDEYMEPEPEEEYVGLGKNVWYTDQEKGIQAKKMNVYMKKRGETDEE